MKMTMIVALYGCMRVDELVKLHDNDFDLSQENVLVTIPFFQKATNEAFKFIIPHIGGDCSPASIVKDYFSKTGHTKGKKFLKRYFPKSNTFSECQNVGKNTVAKYPRKIAEFLQLSDVDGYTGHAFRRTSATIFANAGNTKLELKKFGRWASDTVAESYVEDSVFQKTNFASSLSTAIVPKRHREEEKKEEADPLPKKKKIRKETETSNSEEVAVGQSTYVFTNCTNININF